MGSFLFARIQADVQGATGGGFGGAQQQHTGACVVGGLDAGFWSLCVTLFVGASFAARARGLFIGWWVGIVRQGYCRMVARDQCGMLKC